MLPRRAFAAGGGPVMTRVVVVIVLLVVAGCAGSSTRLGAGGSTTAPFAVPDRVVRVVDGDTLVLASVGKSRLIGVDTPEVFGGRECFGREASLFAKRVLSPGRRVVVERDVQDRDRYGRALVYLRLVDGRSFNEMLVRNGFAVPLEVAPNVRHAKRFGALASRARRQGAGLWSSCRPREN